MPLCIDVAISNRSYFGSSANKEYLSDQTAPIFNAFALITSLILFLHLIWSYDSYAKSSTAYNFV